MVQLVRADNTRPVQPTMTPEQKLRWQRAYEYAKCASAVRRNHVQAGTEALFDHALNNGLAVIVEASWPGQDVDKVRVKSASGLLDVLVAQAAAPATANTAGTASGRPVSVTADPITHVITLRLAHPTGQTNLRVMHLPNGFVPGSDDVVVVDVPVLRDAIRIAHPVRHGRPRQGELTSQHVDALLALGGHPDLQGLLSGQQADEDYGRDKARDLWLADNALDYLAVIGDEEAERRAGLASRYLPADPKDRLLSHDVQDCPVCCYTALLPTSIDSFGVGIGAGHCIVCGYHRNKAAAEEEAAQFLWLNYHKDE